MNVLKTKIGVFKFNHNNSHYRGNTTVIMKLPHMMTKNSTPAVIFNTSECGARYPKLSTRRLPITALVSFHSSGNTWTRHLVQQMTGAFEF